MRDKRFKKERRGRLARFVRDQRGAVGMLFALAAIPMFALAGGVIDYVYIQNEKEKLQNAADAAVLASMRLESPTDDEIRTTIIDYLRSNYVFSPRVSLDDAEIQVDVERVNGVLKRVHVVIPAEVKTTFWGLVGVSKARLEIVSEASQGSAGLEVVLVLDNTGSMNTDGKINELKTAAQELVDTLEELAHNSQMESVKLGLVPYTFAVNVGTDKAGETWLDMSTCCNGYEWRGWVGSRPVPYDALDENYSLSPIPATPSVVVTYNRRRREYEVSAEYDNLRPIVPLQDLSDPNAAEMIRTELQLMEADGPTYIPAGLIWGWRVLSPQPPYTEAMDFAQARAQNVRKVVILMTDGSNTTHTLYDQVSGLPNIKEFGYYDYIVSDANDRMRNLCAAMQAQGILIASIAYQVTDNTDQAETIREIMEGCGNFGYYTPEQGELTDVFRDIARRLTKLHLSQ